MTFPRMSNLTDTENTFRMTRFPHHVSAVSFNIKTQPLLPNQSPHKSPSPYLDTPYPLSPSYHLPIVILSTHILWVTVLADRHKSLVGREQICQPLNPLILLVITFLAACVTSSRDRPLIHYPKDISSFPLIPSSHCSRARFTKHWCHSHQCH